MSDTGIHERRMAVAELRVEPGETDFRPVIRGYAVVFDTLSENLGGFREQIAPAAVERTLREQTDIRALVDHLPERILGRWPKPGTLRLAKDGLGLRVEIDPPNTSIARDAVESIRRGDVTGMSFGFYALGEDRSWWSERDGVPIRTVRDMRMTDVSVVTYPAYVATHVEAALRSLATYGVPTGTYRPSLALLERLHRQRLTETSIRRTSVTMT